MSFFLRSIATTEGFEGKGKALCCVRKEGKPKGSRYPLYRVGLFTMAPKPISDLELEKASRAGLTTKGVATEDHPPLLDPRR